MNSPLAAYLFQEELYNVPPPTVVILAQPWESYNESDRALLGKILGSVKIDVGSVRILTRQTLSMDELAFDQATKVLIFGSAVDLAGYQPVQAQGFTVVKADDLTQLDDVRKKSLWGALRQMFSL